MIHGALFSSHRVDHYTPARVVERVVRALGVIDLDPCSNSREAPNIPAGDHFTQTENGLSRPWFGRVYMNPPYGREIGKWARKLVDEYRAGNVHSAVALLPARMDTKWFREFGGFPVCFIRGRLRFLDQEGREQESAPFPSVVIYLGPEPERFYTEFQSLGEIYLPWAGGSQCLAS